MSTMLDDAVAVAKKLPESEQETIAALILAEIEADQRWEKSFARSTNKLQELAAKAREQVKKGEYVEKGFDEL